MSSYAKDVYGGNYQKAKRLAIARSGGKCQFCGLREASDGHHWAWPDYPSGEEVQEHDITALCRTCHELATLLRDWVERKHADFDQIAYEFIMANNFYEKREAFSYWLFPEEDEFDVYERPYTYEENATSFEPFLELSIDDQLANNEITIEYNAYVHAILERQLNRHKTGESLDSRKAKKDAKEIHRHTNLPVYASQYSLQLAYDVMGMEMQKDMKARRSLQNQARTRTKEAPSFEKKMWLFFFWIPAIGIFLFFALYSVL